ncbi:hypothetical protein JCM8097_002502 [Rhodosporidiobolus ruineniae]
MLARLPVELLRAIFREAAPHTSIDDWYPRSDRHVLGDLSLTCRLFRDIAQPMLPEVLQVCLPYHGIPDTAAYLPLEEEAWTRIAPLVKSLRVSAHEHENPELPPAFFSCVAVRTLEVEYVTFTGKDLAKLPNLRCLVIRGSLLSSPSDFPNDLPIRQLLLHEVETRGTSTISFVTAERFPHLRILDVGPAGYDTRYRSTVSASVPWRALDAFGLFGDDSKLPRPTDFRRPQVLVSLLSHQLRDPWVKDYLPVNIRIVLHEHNDVDCMKCLNDLLALLHGPYSHPSATLLTLSLQFKRFYDWRFAPPPEQLDAKCKAVQQWCERNGTVFLWDTLCIYNDEYQNHLLTPAFLDYRRRAIC